MKTHTLGDGLHPSVVLRPSDVVVAFQETTSRALAIAYLTTTFEVEALIRLPLDFETLAYPRLIVWDAQLWVAYRSVAPVFGCELWNLETNDHRTLGPGYGNKPIALGHGYVAWQQPDGAVYRQRLVGGPSVPAGMTTPPGLSRILPDGTVRSEDEDRLVTLADIPCSVPGFAGPLTVGQREPSGLVGAISGASGLLALWPDEDTMDPQAAWLGEQGACVTWGRQGVRLALVSAVDLIPAWPAPVDLPPRPPGPKPPTPPRPRPPVPPQPRPTPKPPANPPAPPKERHMWPYSDDEANAFMTWLNDGIYVGLLGRAGLDMLGVFRWVHDYLRHRDAGLDDAAAKARVERSIREIEGLPFEPAQGEPGPSPEPPSPAPSGIYIPGTWHPESHGDAFNLQIDGEIWWDWVGMTLYEPGHPRLERLYAEIQSRRYTRLHYTISDCPEAFERPDERFIPALQDCLAHGIGPIIELLPPGSERAWRDRWTRNPREYLGQLPVFVRVIEPYVAEWIVGVEADAIFPTLMPEDRTNPAIIDAGRFVRAHSAKPIWVHFSSGWHGEWGTVFWGTAKDFFSGLAFQYKKSTTSGSGFDTSEATIRESVPLYRSRLKGVATHLEFVHAEAVHMRSEARSRQLADLALSLGAASSMNGGRGVA